MNFESRIKNFFQKFLKIPFSKSGFAVIELVVLVTLVLGTLAATKLVQQNQNPQKQAATSSGQCVGWNTQLKQNCSIFKTPGACDLYKSSGCTWKTSSTLKCEAPTFACRSLCQSDEARAIDRDSDCPPTNICCAAIPPGKCSPPVFSCRSLCQSDETRARDRDVDCPPTNICCTKGSNTPTPIGGGGTGPSGGTGPGGPGGDGGGYTGSACSTDSNVKCNGKNVGDGCGGASCTTDGATGPDGKLICKCNTGGGGDGGQPGGGDGGGDYGGFLPPATENRKFLCQSLVIDPNSVAPGSSFTLTSTSKENANTFYYAFYNKDNLYGPGNPKPICVTTGGDVDWPTTQCPTGTSHLMYRDPDTTTPRTSGSRTITYEDVFDIPDSNNAGQPVKNIQVNGYFLQNDNPYNLSRPEVSCAKGASAAFQEPPPGEETPTPAPPEEITPTPVEDDEKALCENQGFEWKTFPNSCVDSCELAADPTINCLQALTPGCDCGPDACWDGSTCVGNPTPPQDWYAPDGNKCNKTNYNTYYRDRNCIEKAGYSTEIISEDEPQNLCTPDAGFCFAAGGLPLIKQEVRSFNNLIDTNCQELDMDDRPPQIWDFVFNCRMSEEPTGEIGGEVTVDYVERTQFERLIVYLRDLSEDNYITFIAFPKEDIRRIPDNTPLKFKFPKLFKDKRYELYAKVFEKGGQNIETPGITYETSCGNYACDAGPGTMDLWFKITLPDPLERIKADPSYANKLFEDAIDGWTKEEISAIEMSRIIEKIQRVPGLQKTSCDPKIPGGCTF